MWKRAKYKTDGAPSHFSRKVRRHLDKTFTFWIDREGIISWPLRSLALSTLDFYVWGCLKEWVYNQKVNSEALLKEIIVQEAIELQRVMTEAVTGRQVCEIAHICLFEVKWCKNGVKWLNSFYNKCMCTDLF